MNAIRREWKQPFSTLGLLLIGCAIAVLGTAAPAPPSYGQAPSIGQPPAEWCPSGTESFDVLILMDESRSLRRTDPERQRIRAVENLIKSLEGEVSEELRVRVALASFGTDFEMRKGFTDLAQEGTGELIEEVRGFSEDDWNTDYVLALYGATTLDWSAECNRVVWYTDGEHDLTDAPKGGAESMAPRAYDARERELTRASTGRAVQALLIPAVCGSGDVGDVATGYGDLSDRLASLDVEVEFALFYFGDLEAGDSQALIAMMEVGECGDGVYLTKQILDPEETIVLTPPTTTTTTAPTTTTTTTTLPPPPPPICEGLSAPHQPGGREVVWSGVPPDGVAPAFVRSVVVRAVGSRAELSTEYSSQTLREEDGRLRLTLDFPDAVFSSVPRSVVTVHGERVEEACVSFVLETPSLEARTLTSPIFPDTEDIRIQIQVAGNPIAVEDVKHLTLTMDGEVARPEVVGEGTFLIPLQAAVGDHDFEATLNSRYAEPATATGSFTVTSKPDGPIMRLGSAGLDFVTSTEFEIPVMIDDAGREGDIRLLPTDPIVGTDGESVTVEVRFPNGTSVWSSGSPKPDTLMVILGDSVQTPDDHVLHMDYESDPSDPAGETRTVPLAVPVDIDHPRNLVVEAIIVAALLALLLLVIWVWLFGINRVAGRIRRPSLMRWSHFRVSEAWALAADLPGEGHRRVKQSPSRLEAGRLRAKRKSSLLAWRFPHVELSMESSRRFMGVIGEGFDAIEISGRSARLLSESWLRRTVVLVDVSKGPPFEGVVMAPIDPAWPAEEQFTEHVRAALERLERPEQLEPDQK